jgi:hypothetical protein
MAFRQLLVVCLVLNISCPISAIAGTATVTRYPWGTLVHPERGIVNGAICEDWLDYYGNANAKLNGQIHDGDKAYNATIYALVFSGYTYGHLVAAGASDRAKFVDFNKFPNTITSDCSKYPKKRVIDVLQVPAESEAAEFSIAAVPFNLRCKNISNEITAYRGYTFIVALIDSYKGSEVPEQLYKSLHKAEREAGGAEPVVMSIAAFFQGAFSHDKPRIKIIEKGRSPYQLVFQVPEVCSDNPDATLDDVVKWLLQNSKL